MNMITRFTILILLVSMFMAKMKNNSNDNSRYLILGEDSMDTSSVPNGESDSEGTDFDFYDETLDIDFISKDEHVSRAGESGISIEDDDFKFIVNMKCDRETVLCFISNWNDTMDELVDNDYFKFCFNLDLNTYAIGRDLFLVRNQIIQMTLSDVISYFVIALSNQEPDSSVPINPDMNCDNFTIDEATIPPDATENPSTEIPRTPESGENICKVKNIPNGCKMPCTCTCSPENGTEPQCEIDPGNRNANESTPALEPLIEQIDNLKKLLDNLDEERFEQMANRVENLNNYLNLILNLHNMSALPNITGDVRTDIEPIVEMVKNLTLVLANRVWNDSCCTKCTQAVEELANSTLETINDFKAWSLTHFRKLVEQLKELDGTVNKLIVSDGLQSQAIEELVQGQKLLDGNFTELRNEFETFRDALTVCCMTMKTKMADLQKNVTVMQNETLKSLHAIHRRINQLAEAVWQIVESIFDDFMELQEDTQLKFDNLTKRMDDLENKYKDVTADLEAKVEKLNDTIKDLINNVTELAEKVEAAINLIPRVDQMEKDIEELKKDMDAKMDDKFKELEDLIKQVNETLTKVQEEQEANNKAVNDEQTKRLDDLENNLDKMLHNETCPKECLDKIDALGEAIKNVTDEQKLSNQTNDKRLDDLDRKVDNNTNWINDLDNKITECCENQTAKEDKQNELNNELQKQLNETIDNLGNLKEACENNNTILTDRISELENLLGNKSDAIEKLEECCKKNDDLQQNFTAELEALKVANKSTNLRIDELELQVKNLSDAQAAKPGVSDWSELIERVTVLEKGLEDCKDCKGDNEKLQKQIDDLTRRVEILEEKVQELNNTVTNGTGGGGGAGGGGGSDGNGGGANGGGGDGNGNIENECIIAQAEINEDLDERLFAIEKLFNITSKPTPISVKKITPKPNKHKNQRRG